MKLTSWEVARRNINGILAGLNANPALLFAAAANPLLALQELGYEIPPEMLQEFEDRLRFGYSGYERAHELRKKIFKIAGHSFDLNSPQEVRDVLSDLMGKAGRRSHDRALTIADVAPLPFAGISAKAADPLERFQKLHPIVAPLLELRRLDASTPRFASPERYADIRRGKLAVPFIRLAVHLDKRPTAKK